MQPLQLQVKKQLEAEMAPLGVIFELIVLCNGYIYRISECEEMLYRDVNWSVRIN